MSGDYSRDSFDALNDYAGVFLEQGRPLLDSQWNEMVSVLERRIRAGTVDTIGRAVVPQETPNGFRIFVTPDGRILVGRGRKYLDGLLLECHGAASFNGTQAGLGDPAFDRARTRVRLNQNQQQIIVPEGVLDEMISNVPGDFLDYRDQPYWPRPEPLPDLEVDGFHLAYLVAWKREVTALENPDLLEPALGGIDTTTRWQTVWQVRTLANVAPDADCGTLDDQLAGWVEEMAPSTARLTTGSIAVEDPEDPCLVPPTDGYSGIENQLYRIELHSVGENQGDAVFKFSRENASVAAPVESIADPADRITVGRIGRDEILRFRAGDWVELTDDHREFNHRSGRMLRISAVHEETRHIEFEEAIDADPDGADLIPSGTDGDTVTDRRSRLIRWDQRGVIRQANGVEWVNLDASSSNGLIPVPDDGTTLVLESGITVSFSTAAGPGSFREMDYWRFAARTAGTQVGVRRNAPPDGVQRHYCRLAILRASGGSAETTDCRLMWPAEDLAVPALPPGAIGPQAPTAPVDSSAAASMAAGPLALEARAVEGHSGEVRVTPEGHSSGALTIQAAVDRIGAEGGTVRLDGGAYELDGPIMVSGRRGIVIQGQGAATSLSYRGSGGALRVLGSLDVRIEGLGLLAAPDDDEAAPLAAGITIANSGSVTLRRLAVVMPDKGAARQDHGIAIDGLALDTRIEDCLVLAPVALGSTSSMERDDDGPAYVAHAELKVRDNTLVGARAAIRFEGLALNLATAVFAGNRILGREAGVQVNWLEPSAGTTAFEGNAVVSNGDGLRLGAKALRLRDNGISAGAVTSDGVRLVSNLVPGTAVDASLVGNRIGDLSGAGLRIDGAVAALQVEGNVIRRCGEAGIATGPSGSIRHAAIDGNVIEDIARAPRQSGGGAIVLTATAGGRIAGNSIHGVGSGVADAAFSGIALQGVGELTIESNAISAIGSDAAASTAVGVLCRAPYSGLSLRANRISGRLGADGPNWIAIGIGSPDSSVDPNVTAEVTTEVPGTDPAEQAVFEVAGEVLRLSAEGLAVIGEVQERQITIQGNRLRHGADSSLPMVLVAEPDGPSVVFTENHCRLESGGAMSALVVIAAERVVAGNNLLRRESDLDAMRLSVGTNGAAAVLGNITSGDIQVVPGGLNPAFDALNVISR